MRGSVLSRLVRAVLIGSLGGAAMAATVSVNGTSNQTLALSLSANFQVVTGGSGGNKFVSASFTSPSAGNPASQTSSDYVVVLPYSANPLGTFSGSNHITLGFSALVSQMLISNSAGSVASCSGGSAATCQPDGITLGTPSGQPTLKTVKVKSGASTLATLSYNQLFSSLTSPLNLDALKPTFLLGDSLEITWSQAVSFSAAAMKSGGGSAVVGSSMNCKDCVINYAITATRNQTANTTWTLVANYNDPIFATPEPSTYALMGAGLVGLSLLRRRAKR